MSAIPVRNALLLPSCCVAQPKQARAVNNVSHCADCAADILGNYLILSLMDRDNCLLKFIQLTPRQR